MSTAAFKTVREVSSEDAVHGAANLLKMQPNKKWKTYSSGEKSAYVILELEEAQQIIGIDVGNEHSAFIEVLVSKSGCKNDDFKEILLASSFMTPIESKNSTNVNRVRCFNKEALVEATQQDKWKLVKVICIQPFNKSVQYGLCFIKVHVAATQKKSLVPEKFLQKTTTLAPAPTATQTQTLAMQPKPNVFGRFKLREFSSDSETESSAGLFSRWKTSRQSNDATKPTTTAAASIREASKLSDSRKSGVQQHTTIAAVKTSKNSKLNDNELTAAATSSSKVLDRNREDLLFGNNDDDDDKICSSDAKKRLRLSKEIELDQENLRQEKEKLQTAKDKKKRQSIKQIESPTITKITAAAASSTSPSTSKKSLDAVSSHSKDNRSLKRMSSPSDGNRSNVKSKKLKSNDVSHTLQYRPFNQLLRGVVLVISGIQNPDRADLRSKALALGARYKADWEHGCTHLICAFKNTPKYNHVKGKGKIVTRSWIEKCYALKKYLPWRRYALDSSELTQPESDVEILDESFKPSKTLDVFNIDETRPEKDFNLNNNNTLALYDQEDNGRHGSQGDNGISEDSDTDDELQRVAKTNRGKKCDIFEMSTEEEDFLKEKLQKENLFFGNTKFCICDDISAVDKIKLTKFIRKYGGKVISGDDSGDATFLITESAAKSKLDKSLGRKMVRPLWIYECNDMEMRVPEERYLVAK